VFGCGVTCGVDIHSVLSDYLPCEANRPLIQDKDSMDTVKEKFRVM
jgi:hypothetical protein